MTENLQPDDRGTELKKLSRKMVHSLNNMIFIIDAYTDFIEKDQSDPETISNIKRIKTAVDQSQRILRDWRTEADKIVPDAEGEQQL